jgi:hypothetical protein
VKWENRVIKNTGKWWYISYKPNDYTLKMIEKSMEKNHKCSGKKWNKGKTKGIVEHKIMKIIELC